MRGALRILVALGLGAWTLWAALAVWYGFPSSSLRGAAASAFLALAVVAAARLRPRVRAVLAVCCGCAAVSAWFASWRPRDDRPWRAEVTVAPSVSFDGDRCTVHGVRDFTYRSRDDFDARWEDRDYDLRDVRAVDLLVCSWGSERMAHTMLSFEFGSGGVLGVSVEARLEQGERWGPVAGLFRQYELVYVLADERDLVGVRVDHRGEDVFLYRLDVPPDAAARLLRRILVAADDLRAHPRFYRTLARNCTTTLVDHVNAIWPQRIPYGRKVLLNAYTPEVAREQGLLHSDLSPAELRERARITDLARGAAGEDGFSRRIRAHLR